jgi:hypothetical protein
MADELGNINSQTQVALKTDTDDLQSQIDAIIPPNALLNGGVYYTGSGFIYDVSALLYRIQGTIYTSAPQQVTLSASDPTNDRIDVIVADNTGAVGVVTGTPAPSPVKPPINNLTQVEVTFVNVIAGSTTPSVVTILAYDENAGTPTEWNATTDDLNVNLASTNDPFPPSSVSIETNSPLGTNKEIKLQPSSPYTNNGGYVTFQLKAKQDMTSASGVLYVGWFDSGNFLLGNAVQIAGTSLSTWGFDGSNTSSYQLVTIPFSAFGVLPSALDSLKFFKTTGSSTANFFLDLVQIQEGTFTPQPSTSGHIIADEGIDLPQQPTLDFQGAGVTATDDSLNNKTIVTIAGGGGGSWNAPHLNLADWLNNGASSLLNANAGFQKSFSATANDEIVNEVTLYNNGLAYDGSGLSFRIHWQLFSVTPSPADTVIWELDAVLVAVGEDADSKTATLISTTIDVTGRTPDILYTDFLSASLVGLAGAKVLGLTLRRRSSGGGADSYSGIVDLFGFEIL